MNMPLDLPGVSIALLECLLQPLFQFAQLPYSQYVLQLAVSLCFCELLLSVIVSCVCAYTDDQSEIQSRCNGSSGSKVVDILVHHRKQQNR